jgi:putative ABC transport system substrate-binding protein
MTSRREFITLVGGAAAWPLAARAQQPAKPVVGFLSSRSAGESANHIAAFRQGLSEAGFVEGQNVVIEYRWAEGQFGRLPALATQLIHHPVAVIAATGGPASGMAVKQITSTLPFVFIADDPVRVGLVTTLNRPGGTATGVNVFQQEMEGKRLGLLRELVPTSELIGILMNASGGAYDMQIKQVEDSARSLGQRIHVVRAESPSDIDRAFTALSELKPGALLVTGNPFFLSRREQIIALANQHRIPAIYEAREFVQIGGLMSYGTSLPDAYRQVGVYAGRILKGEKPGDLPVVQSTKFEFSINLKTARALGIDVPGTLSARADEIIE